MHAKYLTQSTFTHQTRYDGYSSIKLDEYTTWDHYLEGNNSIYFLGGYGGCYSVWDGDGGWFMK